MSTPAPSNGGFVQPTIGRIIHVQQTGNDIPVPAIVTFVHDDGDRVDATGYPRGGATMPYYRLPHVGIDPDAVVEWEWPPRV